MKTEAVRIPPVTTPPAANRRMTRPWKSRLTTMTATIRPTLIQKIGLISSRIGSAMIRPRPDITRNTRAPQIQRMYRRSVSAMVRSVPARSKKRKVTISTAPKPAAIDRI